MSFKYKIGRAERPKAEVAVVKDGDKGKLSYHHVMYLRVAL